MFGTFFWIVYSFIHCQLAYMALAFKIGIIFQFVAISFASAKLHSKFCFNCTALSML